MKTYKNLYDRITSFENLLLAARRAQKGKRFVCGTAQFNLNLENELIQLQRELQEKTYRHGGYRDFIIYDPKQRLISAAPYRDRVVHHALCNVIEPIFDRTFIHDSYACRLGKGTHAAVRRYTHFARKYPYVLKCDIQKYFQSVDQEILFGIVGKKIRCRDTLWLIRQILSSHADAGSVFYFETDDLFTPYERRRAIPIGNLTSQFFANVYLNGFDHFVKERLNCRAYIRYVDDFVVFDDSKERLHSVRRSIADYLSALRLRLHENKSRIYRVADGVRFLGYRIFPTHRLVLRENAVRMRRKLKKFSRCYQEGSIDLSRIKQTIQSWIGHVGHADSHRLRSRVLGGVVFQRGGAGGAAGRFVVQQP